MSVCAYTSTWALHVLGFFVHCAIVHQPVVCLQMPRHLRSRPRNCVVPTWQTHPVSFVEFLLTTDEVCGHYGGIDAAWCVGVCVASTHSRFGTQPVSSHHSITV